MNLQDITDFLDLVKNPSKYEAHLKNLKDEQGRLNAAIETVGKASKLDGLRKDVEKRQAILEEEFRVKHEALVKKQEELLDTHQKSKSVLFQHKCEVDDLAKKANEKFAQAVELENISTSREKELSRREADITNREQAAQALISEYKEKIKKLYSVMV